MAKNNEMGKNKNERRNYLFKRKVKKQKIYYRSGRGGGGLKGEGVGCYIGIILSDSKSRWAPEKHSHRFWDKNIVFD